ncbi:MAG TPA: hypothetical protein HPP81_01310 [Deltaproteobacteria bacterium]|jgi:hypothetical protein|nr:hypothetical protein [Deltaproteobacteria bacterium]
MGVLWGAYFEIFFETFFFDFLFGVEAAAGRSVLVRSFDLNSFEVEVDGFDSIEVVEVLAASSVGGLEDTG